MTLDLRKHKKDLAAFVYDSFDRVFTVGSEGLERPVSVKMIEEVIDSYIGECEDEEIRGKHDAQEHLDDLEEERQFNKEAGYETDI